MCKNSRNVAAWTGNSGGYDTAQCVEGASPPSFRAAPETPATWSGFRPLTFWQTAADMIFSTGVPAGHGHSYGANPVDAWAAIYPPDGWTAAKNEQLRAIVGTTDSHD